MGPECNYAPVDGPFACTKCADGLSCVRGSADFYQCRAGKGQFPFETHLRVAVAVQESGPLRKHLGIFATCCTACKESEVSK